jgi:cyclopropane fatty-acyl-phospholipid synthase-like methyltransferase
VENAPTLSGSSRASSLALNLLRFSNRIGHLLRPNARRIARRNIGEHYDLSNDFFSLWLDPSMMYSAARWPAGAPHVSLEEAQREKNDALCRALRLSADDHVLEIGTGWGGWALHAASTYGCRVTTVTISQAQHDYAVRRIAAAGLAGRVDVQLRDFRDLDGQFDKIVSIEMMEALGHRYQEEFARVVARCLRPEGLVALQFITCPDARYGAFRRGVDFIQKHIFPGSLLLSLNRVNDLLSTSGGFVLHRVDDFGPDYARTLRQLACDVHRAPRRRAGARVRRTLHPQMELLPLLLRGGLRPAQHLGRAHAAHAAEQPPRFEAEPTAMILFLRGLFFGRAGVHASRHDVGQPAMPVVRRTARRGHAPLVHCDAVRHLLGLHGVFPVGLLQASGDLRAAGLVREHHAARQHCDRGVLPPRTLQCCRAPSRFPPCSRGSGRALTFSGCLLAIAGVGVIVSGHARVTTQAASSMARAAPIVLAATRRLSRSRPS